MMHDTQLIDSWVYDNRKLYCICMLLLIYPSIYLIAASNRLEPAMSQTMRGVWARCSLCTKASSTPSGAAYWSSCQVPDAIILPELMMLPISTVTEESLGERVGFIRAHHRQQQLLHRRCSSRTLSPAASSVPYRCSVRSPVRWLGTGGTSCVA